MNSNAALHYKKKEGGLPVEVPVVLTPTAPLLPKSSAITTGVAAAPSTLGSTVASSTNSKLSRNRYGSLTRRRRRSLHHNNNNNNNNNNKMNIAPRATSVPVAHARRIVIMRRPIQRQPELTIREQTTKLAEEAQRNLFHGSFTSSHGAMFLVPPVLRQEKLHTAASERKQHGEKNIKDLEMSQKTKLESVNWRPNMEISAPSALKKDKSLLQQQQQQRKDHHHHHHHDKKGVDDDSFLKECIILPPRSSSLDAKSKGQYRETSTHVCSTFVESFPESTPDLLALERIREDATKRGLLSQSTIDKANKALEEYDEKMKATTAAVAAKRVEINKQKEDKKLDNFKVLHSKSNRITFSEHVTIPSTEDYSEEDDDDDDNDEEEMEDEEEDENEELLDGELTYSSAILHLLTFASPAAVTIGFTFALSVVPLAFIGSYLGERSLTGASVGYFILCIIALYPTIGMTFAMDTLCSHEFGRDSRSQELGVLLQRGILINLVFLIPEFFFMYKLDPWFVKLYGQDVADVASDFLFYMPLFMFPLMIFIAFTKFLSNQMQPQMPMIALTAGFAITPFIQMKFTPMGVRYTTIGMAITAWFQLFIVIVMTLFNSKTRHTLGSLRIFEALRPSDVKDYLRLAIPSAIFVAAEASSFDVSVLLCAYFGEQQGAAWSGIMNVLFIFASVAGGMSAGACANIGRCIGSNRPINARTYVETAITLSLVIGIFNSAILYFFFDFLMSLFGTKGKTLILARQCLTLLPFFHLADAVQFTFQGIFSGIGKNHLGALILLLSLWGVGIPLAFFLGVYLQFGVFGVCLGLTIGLCIEAPAMVVVTCLLDYHAVCHAFILAEEDSDEEETEEETEEEEEESDEEVKVVRKIHSTGSTSESGIDEESDYNEDVIRRSGISVSAADFDNRLSRRERRLQVPPHRNEKKE